MALAAAAAACGGGAPAGQSPAVAGPTAGATDATGAAAPLEPGPACDAVAAHVVRITVQEKAARGNYWQDDQIAAMTSIIQTRCEQDRWSGAARACMEQVSTRKDARTCFEQLTPAQQDAMQRDEQTKLPKRDGATAAPE